MQGYDKQLRESIRLMERRLGLLRKEQYSCCGVTMAQCHAIVEVGRAGIISLNDLAATLSLDKSTTSRTVDNLVQTGLLKREEDDRDRRFVQITLSERGMALYKSIEESMDDYYRCVTSAIPEDKRTQVLDSLEILLSALLDAGAEPESSI